MSGLTGVRDSAGRGNCIKKVVENSTILQENAVDILCRVVIYKQGRSIQ